MKYSIKMYIFNKRHYSLHTSDILLNLIIKGAVTREIEKGWCPKKQEEFDEIVKKIAAEACKNLSTLLDHAESVGRGDYP